MEITFSRLTQMALVLGFAAATLSAQGILGDAGVRASAIDSKGFIYLAGNASIGLQTTPDVLQPVPPSNCVPGECNHGFVAKLAPSGNNIVWMTYWGGDGRDSISALAIAPDGNIVIAGSTTSKNLLPNLNGYQTKPESLFIAKLSADGKSLLAGTYFGGSGTDTIAALRLDRAGNVYVAGGAYQTKRGTAPPPPQYSLDCSSTCTDQFVAKFDLSLAKLQFSTLFGTVIRESTGDLAVGLDGTLYLSGVRGPYANTGPGPTNPILTRLSADASSVIYSVEAGSRYDGVPVVVDPDGNAYIATWSPRWPIGGLDSVTLKVDPRGNVLWKKQISSIITSMALNSRAELVVTGLGWRLLEPTTGAPRLCTSYTSFRPVEAYVARLNTSTGAITYTGFLNANQSWLVGPDQVLADSAYVGIPQFSVFPAANPPAGTVTCIANAASYDRTAIAPGEILSVFGTEIGPNRPFHTELDAQGNVNKELGGMTVSIGDLPAPILYADAGQINLVAPFAIPTSGTVPVEIRRNGSLIASFNQKVIEIHSGLFRNDGNGSVYGSLAALNQDGSVNGASNPASPGSVITVFGTGFGAMTPAVPDGAATCQPVNKPVTTFSTFPVYGDGGPVSVPAEIEYIGNAPCLVQGAVQINLRIPTTIKPSDGIIMLSNFGTIAVR